MKALEIMSGGRLWAQALPVLSAIVLTAVDRQLIVTNVSWSRFAYELIFVLLMMIPLVAAHIAACRLDTMPASVIWLVGFIAYPAGLTILGGSAGLPAKYWVLAVIFSLLFLFAHPQARNSVGRAAATPVPNRLPISLDGSIIALLLLWTIVTTSLFASTEDAVRNQPLRVWFSVDRIVAQPGETLWYLWQFGRVALILFGYYWMCRYGLVRRILQQQGIVPFAFATMILLAIWTPLTGSAVLLLPINIPEWTLLPSENHNPFDPINYRFMVWFTAVLVPLILVIERLLSEQADAGKRHEHVRAELHQLQQQINPHFLFNTLNTLYSLCLRDRTESAEAVIKLSDLLRYVVYQGQAQRTSLVDEIAYLRNYLDLQMLRYGHRCQLDCVWPDDPVDVALPPLLLIMLVENAFKHGVEPVDGPCHIRIDMTVEGQRLHFECVNALPATPVSGPAGLGLANLRRRLALIYGTNFQLDTGPAADGWRSRLALDLEPC